MARNGALSPRGTIKAAILIIHHHTNIYDDPTDMGLRDSFSRLKKRFKHLVRKRKPGRTGINVGGENINPANPLPRPQPHAEADNGEGDGADTDGWQTYSTDRSLQPDGPERVPAGGIENDQEGGETDGDGREASPRYSHPDPDIEGGAGSGPSQEGNGANAEEGEQSYSRSPIPSNPGSREPDGM